METAVIILVASGLGALGCYLWQRRHVQRAEQELLAAARLYRDTLLRTASLCREEDSDAANLLRDLALRSESVEVIVRDWLKLVRASRRVVDQPADKSEKTTLTDYAQRNTLEAKWRR